MSRLTFYYGEKASLYWFANTTPGLSPITGLADVNGIEVRRTVANSYGSFDSGHLYGCSHKEVAPGLYHTGFDVPYNGGQETVACYLIHPAHPSRHYFSPILLNVLERDRSADNVNVSTGMVQQTYEPYHQLSELTAGALMHELRRSVTELVREELDDMRISITHSLIEFLEPWLSEKGDTDQQVRSLRQHLRQAFNLSQPDVSSAGDADAAARRNVIT